VSGKIGEHTYGLGHWSRRVRHHYHLEYKQKERALARLLLSDPCEFIWIRNDVNCLNLALLHLNAENDVGVIAIPHDQGCLTIDLLKFETRILRPEVLCCQTEARNGITPMNRTQHRLFDFSAAIRPEGHVLGEQGHQEGHLTVLHRLKVAIEQLLMALG